GDNDRMTPSNVPLLTSLTGDAADLPEAVRVGRDALSRAELLGAAAALADRVAGARVVALDAQPALETVVAAAGCLIAGVPLVPVPKDAGSGERAHILRDSGAQLWIGAPRDDVDLETVPVDTAARSATTYPEPGGEETAMI